MKVYLFKDVSFGILMWSPSKIMEVHGECIGEIFLQESCIDVPDELAAKYIELSTQLKEIRVQLQPYLKKQQELDSE